MQQQTLPLAFIRGEAFIEKPQDLFIPAEALEVTLDSFEGPLDLLLYLIKKQKLDILDLPIATITAQYMKYVELMKELDMELASEYLVMAAMLAEIKSRLLLPKQQVEEDDADPRAELIRRLQAYEVIKTAAQQLDELPRVERDVLLACIDTPLNEDKSNQAQVDLDELVAAMQGVLKRNQAFEHHHIEKELLSTQERMSRILATLTQRKNSKQEGFVDFITLFEPNEGRHGVVVTFLAVLELLKEHLIVCQQGESNGQLIVRLRSDIHVVE